MKKLTISEIKIKKDELRQNILKLLSEFEDKTEVEITL